MVNPEIENHITELARRANPPSKPEPQLLSEKININVDSMESMIEKTIAAAHEKLDELSVRMRENCDRIRAAVTSICADQTSIGATMEGVAKQLEALRANEARVVDPHRKLQSQTRSYTEDGKPL